MPINERDYYRDKFYPGRERTNIQPHTFRPAKDTNGQGSKFCSECGLHVYNSIHSGKGQR